MKQAVLNKLLNTVLRQSAKEYGWQYSRGFVFKVTDLLFFSANVSGQAKRAQLNYLLGYKLLAFDPLFWNIVKLEENQKQPLSFRACGAWTVPTMMIAEDDLQVVNWDADSVGINVHEILTRCELSAGEITKEIQSLDDNWRVIERYYARQKKQYPNSVKNVCLEQLLTLILKNERGEAEKLLQERIIHQDSGGFQYGGYSFYELAREYLQQMR